MLPLCFTGAELFRDIFIDQVCAPHFMVQVERNPMHCEVEEFPVFAPLSHCTMQCSSGKDLRYQGSEVRVLVPGYSQTSNVNRAQLVALALEEVLKSGICQVHTPLLVENGNPQGTILN